MRIENGLSQYELALASDVPRYIIQLAENAVRMPTDEQQKKLASVLGIPVDDLFPAQRENCNEKH